MFSTLWRDYALEWQLIMCEADSHIDDDGR